MSSGFLFGYCTFISIKIYASVRKKSNIFDNIEIQISQ